MTKTAQCYSYSLNTTKLKSPLVLPSTGSGGYGVVVMAVDRRTSEMVAIKRISNVFI